MCKINVVYEINVYKSVLILDESKLDLSNYDIKSISTDFIITTDNHLYKYFNDINEILLDDDIFTFYGFYDFYNPNYTPLIKIQENQTYSRLFMILIYILLIFYLNKIIFRRILYFSYD